MVGSGFSRTMKVRLKADPTSDRAPPRTLRPSSGVLPPAHFRV